MKIAGGMFGFEKQLFTRPNGSPPFMTDAQLLFLSGRCAIQFIIDQLRPPQVWMPSYLCCSIMEAVDRKVTNPILFPIGPGLEILSTSWLNQLIPGSLVILIDYFGFACDTQLITEIQSRGCFVLEDASQALLSTHVGRQSDFVVFSPRKFLGVPDGGILRYRKDAYDFSSVKLLPPPQEWWLKALETCIERREFDNLDGERTWYGLFQQVEAALPTGPYHMSELSEILLERAFDYKFIAATRRVNYSYLADHLSEYALIKELDDGTVPLGFPIRLKNRDNVRQLLFENQIYPPIHWEISECVPASFTASRELSESIMTIPCDQRLKHDDITHILTILCDALGVK